MQAHPLLTWHDFLHAAPLVDTDDEEGDGKSDTPAIRIEMRGSSAPVAQIPGEECALLELQSYAAGASARILPRDSDSLLVILNYAEGIQLSRGTTSRRVEQGHMAILALDERVTLKPLGSPAVVLTLTIGRTYLRSHFGHHPKLLPPIRTFLDDCDALLGEVEIAPMTRALLTAPAGLRHPPQETASHQVWYRSKILEILALSLFRIEQPVPSSQRSSAERVEHAKTLLAENLAKPPSLEKLAKAVGCSPFHLSRQFAAHVGETIPAYLRKKRIERAAELLADGDLSVEKAAHLVGYRSMPSFIHGFREHFSLSPADYAALRQVRAPLVHP